MSFNEVFQVPNMIILVSNVIFFIVVQTFFFKYKASQQINTVIKEKLDILNTYLNYDPELKQKIVDYKTSSEFKEKKKKAEKNAEWRNIENWKLIVKYILPVFGLFTVILIILILLDRLPVKTTKWVGVDTAIGSLVFLAYSTEILFYFGMVRQYTFYGDHELTYNVYSSLKKYHTFNNKKYLNASLLNTKLNDINKYLQQNNIDKHMLTASLAYDIYDEKIGSSTKKQDLIQQGKEMVYNKVDNYKQDLVQKGKEMVYNKVDNYI